MKTYQSFLLLFHFPDFLYSDYIVLKSPNPPLLIYQEVSKAFNEKIAELAEKPSKKDDLQVLLRAAEILGVDLET